MSSKTSIFVAKFESPSTEQLAFGSTPEEAMEAMVKLWINDYCPKTKAEPDYLHQYREEITVAKADLGKGYLIGSFDDLWFDESLNGDDPRFDDVFQKYAPENGMKP